VAGDARFQDVGEEPLRLKALAADDLPVISALLQDAIVPVSEISWMPRRHRFAALLNRFRWEDREAAERERRPYERVRSMLVIDGVLGAASNGVDPADPDLVLSVLALEFEPGEDAGGRLKLILAGDGEIALDVECVDIRLRDVTRPYVAPSQRVPQHPD